MDNNSLKNEVPHSYDDERAILSCIFQNAEVVDTALSLVDHKKFYTKRFSLMFECIEELSSSYQNIDIITVTNKMLSKIDNDKSKNEKEQKYRNITVDINLFRDEILNAPINTQHIKDYCEVVNVCYLKRQTIKISENILSDCNRKDKDILEILEAGQKAYFDLAKRTDQKDYYTVDKIMEDVLNKIREASLTKDGITGIATHFREIDLWTAGFQRSDLIIIAARPSQGKTSFALNLALNMSNSGNKVAFFSIEMPRVAIGERLLSMQSKISSEKLRSGRLNNQDWDDIVYSAERLNLPNLIIDDTSYLTIPELRSKCRKIQNEVGLDVVMLDYIGLMHAGIENYRGDRDRNVARLINNRQEEIAEISRSLKALAKELNVPFIALAQASRSAEEKKETQLSDIRDSGAIEQDADIVIFLERKSEDGSEQNSDAEDNIVTINIKKHRNGRTGKIKLVFDKKTTKYKDIEFVHKPE